jgi:cell fate (sporulation/competence/biofilm development) regulator YlbF (YheA/YmcA/DUF963 family)
MGIVAVEGSAVANEAWGVGFSKQAADIETVSTALEDWITSSESSLKTYHDDIAAAAGPESAWDQYGIAIDEVTQKANALAAALGGGTDAEGNSTDGVSDTIDDYNNSAENAASNGGEDLEQNLNDVADNANKLTSAILGSEEKDGLEGALQKAQECAEKAKDAFEAFKTVIQQTIGEVSALGRNLLALNDKHATVRYEVIQTLTTVDGNSQATGYHSDLNVGSRLPTDPK